MAESIQRTLTRVRPPRVRITYDVEVGNAIIKKELPFVLGIMADLSGHADVPRKKTITPYKERPFVFIDKDNFDTVLEDFMPALQLSSGEKPELHFRSLADFTPARVVRRVDSLNKFLDIRNRLKDMAAKLDGNDELHDTMQKIISENDLETAINDLRSKQAELRKSVAKNNLAPSSADDTVAPNKTVDPEPEKKADDPDVAEDTTKTEGDAS